MRGLPVAAFCWRPVSPVLAREEWSKLIGEHGTVLD